MTDFQASEASLPIESVDQLVEQFHLAAKPRSEWRIGTEYEKLAVDKATGAAAPYSGPHGVEAVLRALAERFGWTSKEEGGRVIALARGRVSITLEPGAQIELAGEACRTVHCTRAEMETHIHELTAVGNELGIAFLGLGIQPVSGVAEIELVPKARYRIMAPYMERVGRRGVRMMKQTATVQANIDFDGERDAMHKLAVGMRLAPLLNAMFANSCIVDGGLTAYRSFRGHVWRDTDRSRCGLLALAFDDAAGFDAYVDWALDVPMYFLLRDGRYEEAVTGVPFRRFLEQGIGGYRATIDDWHLHLTTLFPEVRLKRFIEFRSADAPPTGLILALPALIKGVYYEPDCLDGAWDLVKRWGRDDCETLADEVPRSGLETRQRRVRLGELATELCRIALEGLRRQGALDDDGRDECMYLEPLLELIEDGRTPADLTASAWTHGAEHGLARLVDDAVLHGGRLVA